MILRTFYLSSQKQEAQNIFKTKILEYQIFKNHVKIKIWLHKQIKENKE